MIQGELTVISSRFVECIVVQYARPVRVGLHAEDEKSYTVTGAMVSFPNSFDFTRRKGKWCTL